jgi:hypothetical protein
MPIEFDYTQTVEWLKTKLVDPIVGFAIRDSENALMLKCKSEKIFINFFQDCFDNNLEPIIVGKMSTIQRLQNRLPSLEFPEDLIYFFLHTDPKYCADDAFILELYRHLKNEQINTKIYSIDKFANRMKWEERVVMISSTLYPDRPRSILGPKSTNVITYKPNMSLIKTIDFNDDKKVFRID